MSSRVPCAASRPGRLGVVTDFYSVDPLVLEGPIATRLASAADGVSSARASVATTPAAFDSCAEPTRSAGYEMCAAMQDFMAALEERLTALHGTTMGASVTYATTNNGVVASLAPPEP
jgi:hypothetical protein